MQQRRNVWPFETVAIYCRASKRFQPLSELSLGYERQKTEFKRSLCASRAACALANVTFSLVSFQIQGLSLT